jgi:hypothetical protein
MTETADLNDSTESLFTVFRGRLFQFRIVHGKKDCCLSLYILYYRLYQLYYLSFKIKALLTCTQFNIFSWQLCKININEIVQHKYILYNKSIYIIIVWEYVCMVLILFKQNGSLKILTTGHGKEVNIHAPVRHSVNHW